MDLSAGCVRHLNNIQPSKFVLQNRHGFESASTHACLFSKETSVLTRPSPAIEIIVPA